MRTPSMQDVKISPSGEPEILQSLHGTPKEDIHGR